MHKMSQFYFTIFEMKMFPILNRNSIEYRNVCIQYTLANKSMDQTEFEYRTGPENSLQKHPHSKDDAFNNK